jgi:hypothetical protein
MPMMLAGRPRTTNNEKALFQQGFSYRIGLGWISY